MRDGFIFYSSFYDALADLDDSDRLACYDAICTYAITGKEPEGRGVVSLVFKLVRPQIDANNERRENGKLGGRPKKAEVSEEENHRFLEEETTGINSEEPKYKGKYKDKVKDKEKVKGKEKEIHHRHGEFGHVLLTDREYDKLVEDFGEDLTAGGIKAVDEYCEQKGTSYKNYNLTIRKWGIERAREENQPKAPPEKGQRYEYHNRYNDFPQRDNDYDKIQDDWIRKSFGAPLPVAGRG